MMISKGMLLVEMYNKANWSYIANLKSTFRLKLLLYFGYATTLLFALLPYSASAFASDREVYDPKRGAYLIQHLCLFFSVSSCRLRAINRDR